MAERIGLRLPPEIAQRESERLARDLDPSIKGAVELDDEEDGGGHRNCGDAEHTNRRRVARRVEPEAREGR